jgi:electron transfer flavoprotein alpha/beta subunit
MKIIVLMKQVPNTTVMLIDKEKGTLIRTGVESIMNPDDTNALETALQIKHKLGATVIVMTMGPTQAEEMLRECYARGADECVLISDKAFAGSDTWATSNTLSAAIQLYNPDLICAGRQAIDGDTAQVGPQIAERLNIPQITYVSELIDIKNDSITVKKEYEDYTEIIKSSLPCLITTLDPTNPLRQMNVTDTWNAYTKTITYLTNQDLKLESSMIGLNGSPTQVRKTFTRSVSGEITLIQSNGKEAVDSIMTALSPYLN